MRIIFMLFSIVILLAFIFTANTVNHNDIEKNIRTLSFTPINISSNDEEKKMMRVSPLLTVTYDDNTSKRYDLSYKVLATMGEKIGEGTLGLMLDSHNKPLLQGGEEDISDMPDGNSLISVGEKHYVITHMEERPGALYKTEVRVKEGLLKAFNTEAIDLSKIKGTIINCASSKTAYGSHLGGEEDYALNSIYADLHSPFYIDCALDGLGSDIEGKMNYFCLYVESMQKYLGDTAIDKKNGYNGDTFSPYHYGHIVEVQPQSDGTTRYAKHYVTGKYTPELAIMMPDGKTIYMTDDGTAKGLWKFVSDSKISEFEEEWEGTLYAAKLKQLSSQNGGKFAVFWIALGHAKDSDIEAMIASKMKITDIFDIYKADENGTCPKGTKIYEDSLIECLSLKEGKEKEAAFLESRKYAALKGATMEFRKEEGLTYDADKNLLYISMSQLSKSMEDNYKKQEPMNDIRLPKNACGAVYALHLDSAYSGNSMEALVLGKPLKENEPYAEAWSCHPDAIANPDNIKYIGHHTLLIAEDTTRHVNNMTWAYNTQTKRLTRIASLPIGAEVTGLDTGIVDHKGILLLNIQHPFTDNPEGVDGLTPNVSLLEEASDEALKASIGYIDGLPADIFK